MNSRLIVSTECPTCGAPLDFSEGSNAIQCDHCQSHLLVTGRKQVLSYSIAPKLNAHRAVARAMIAHKQNGIPVRTIKPQLYFIPYYRLTGQDFLWEVAAPEPKPEPTGPTGTMSDLSMDLDWGSNKWSSQQSISLWDLFIKLCRWGLEMYRQRKGIPVVKAIADEPTGKSVEMLAASISRKPVYPTLDTDQEIQFQDRYVEKNFVACDLKGLDMYSLGVRPAVLRLELFQKKVLEARGKVVSVSIPPEEALSHGMKPADSQNILYRAVIGRVLSVIYFPFWMVEIERQGERILTILDAVSEAVVKLDAPTSLYATLDHSSTTDPQVIGFRPLTCPNCGWDFPVKPDDVVFFCSSCGKAWQLLKKDLYEVPYQIAGLLSSGQKEPIKYLPFWMLQARLPSGQVQADKNTPGRFFIPAFRYRRLKVLSDLARNLSKKQPSYPVLDGERPEVHGCYYDQEDAAMLAQFIHVGLETKRSGKIKAFHEEKFSVTNTNLTWFPYKVQGQSLTDPFTSQSLFQNLLL
jgi:DNA-directed RNA polymerase subunit RPC12/RpoP